MSYESLKSRKRRIIFSDELHTTARTWKPLSSARAGLSPKTRRGREKEEKKKTKEGGLSPQEGDLEKVQEKKKTKEGKKVAPAKARFRVSSTKNFFFGSRVFGF